MSNKLKLAIALILASILVIASAVGLNLNPNLQQQSTNFSSKVTSIPNSSSNSVQSSSIPQSSSSISVSNSNQKSEVSKSDVVQNSTTPKCDQPDSLDLVKTEDGCFTFLLNYSFYKNYTPNDEDLVIENSNPAKLKATLKKISTDYFNKISNRYVSKTKGFSLNYLSKINDTEFEVLLSMIDPDYFSQKNLNIATDAESRYNATYRIKENSDNSWIYEFQGFMKDQNGSPIHN